MFLKKQIKILLLLLLLLILIKNLLADTYLRPTFRIQQINGYNVPFETNNLNIVPYPDFQKQNVMRTNIIFSNAKYQIQFQPSYSAHSIEERDLSLSLITNEGNYYQYGYNDSLFSIVSIPGVTETMSGIETVVPVNNGNYVWYRIRFLVHSSWSNQKDIILNFLGANYISDVWLNGQYLGYHEGGYTPFVFDVSDQLFYSATKTNVLAIRVDNIQRGSTLATNASMIPYTKCDFWSYTGLFRQVYLTIQNKVHTVRADIKTKDNAGNISMLMDFQNFQNKKITAMVNVQIFKADFSGLKIQSEILDDTFLSGSPVAQLSFPITLLSNQVNNYNANISIPGPDYWLPANPALYIAKINLSTNNVVVDQYYTQFGLRTLKVINNGVQANGTTTPFLAGVGRHEDSLTKGLALAPSDIYNDLTVIKNGLKCNYIRTGHYPNLFITYKYLDRMGLIAYCEIPVYWFQGLEFDNQVNSRHIHKQMLEEMIYSEFNSPCIWFWGVVNEGSSQSERQNFIQDLYNEAYAIDGTRLIVQAAAGSDVSDATQNACDILGFNMYYGVFYTNQGRGNFYEPTKNALLQMHANFPNKPILITEFGYWSQTNSLNIDSTTNEQLKEFTDTFPAFKDFAIRSVNGFLSQNGFVIGCTWWAAFNWYTVLNGTAEQSMGAIHMNRTTFKPVAYAIAQQYQIYQNTQPDSLAQPNFNNVVAYPNPWVKNKATYNYIIIKNLTANSVVRIYDNNESFIKELPASNGTVFWNLDNFSGNLVPSGVYIYYVLDKNLKIGASGKIMVIR